MTRCYTIILAAGLLAMPKEVAGQQTGEALTQLYGMPVELVQVNSFYQALPGTER